ncbi:hypothetical protein ScPMuIL_004714 [Solemya velum]
MRVHPCFERLGVERCGGGAGSRSRCSRRDGHLWDFGDVVFCHEETGDLDPRGELLLLLPLSVSNHEVDPRIRSLNSAAFGVLLGCEGDWRAVASPAVRESLWTLGVKMLKKVLTLVLVTEPRRVLLGLKKRGFGEGRWNGFGGKVEKGETIVEAAKRELEEECGLVSDELKRIGLLNFEFVEDPVLLEVHVFTTSLYKGIPTESSEMKPEWFDLSNIPFHQMWPDDRYWFPLFLKGSKFTGYFLFQGHNDIIKHTLTEVDTLDSLDK